MSRVKPLPSLTSWARRPVATWAMKPPRRAEDDAVARVDKARHGDEGAVHLSQLEGHDALPLVAITELDHRLAQILDRLTAG